MSVTSVINWKIYSLSLGGTDENSESIYIDETVDGLTLGQGGIPIETRSSDKEETFTDGQQAVVRKGLTTSRENLSYSEHSLMSSRVSASPENQLVYREGQEGRKKIEMRQYLEPAVQSTVKSLDQSLINTVNSSSLSISRVCSESLDKISRSVRCMAVGVSWR